ncbi:MAG: hypothetical protein VKM97_00960 [Cyanobacteriota bacterium]|nr:hypothetical protein [Cyanobacteriota bacterium]
MDKKDNLKKDMKVYIGKKANPTDYYVVEIETPDDQVGGPISEETVAVQAYASGFIFEGVVTEIRKYTYNFSKLDFESTFTNLGSYNIIAQTGPFTETNSFIVGNSLSISRTYMKRGTVYIGPIADSFGDKNAAYDRQRNHFLRTSPTNPSLQFETEIITGSKRLDIYGSFERTLHELRNLILSEEAIPSFSEKARDRLVGSYFQYHPNGNLRQVFSYSNPTMTGDSLLQGDYYEYYENGNTKVIGHFTANFLNGLYKQFYPSGILQTNCVIVNGKLQGQYNQYTSEGNREFIAFYTNGTLDGSYVLDYQI